MCEASILILLFIVSGSREQFGCMILFLFLAGVTFLKRG